MTTKQKAMDALKVKDVMTHLVVTLRPGDTVMEAAKRLLSNRISGAPVVEDGRPVGVVSEGDLMKAFLPSPKRGLMAAPYPLMFLLLRDTPRPDARRAFVGDVMPKDVVKIGQDEDILEAASMMDRYGVRRLPVVDQEGFLVGVVARSDLVRCMARSQEERRAS